MPKLFTGEGKEPIKVACRTCIDGHRSPTCIHLNRILVQVRQPGRPKHRCVHARPSEGIHRCTNCFPLVAYVVPGHKSRGCGCRIDPNETIKEWQTTSEDVAEEHESKREEVKEIRRKQRKQFARGNRSSSSSDDVTNEAQATRTCCSSNQASATSAGPGAHISGEYIGPAREPPPSEPFWVFGAGATSGQAAYITPDDQVNARQFVTPWLESLRPGPGQLSTIDECLCGDDPGQCTCIGCARHANNQATLDFVEQTWASQGVDLPCSEFGSQLQTPTEAQSPSTATFYSTEPVSPGAVRNISSSSGAQPSQTRPLQYPIPPSPVFQAGQDTVINPLLLGQSTPFDPYAALGPHHMNQHNQYQAYAMVGPCPICLCGENCQCAGCPCHDQYDIPAQPASATAAPASGSCCNPSESAAAFPQHETVNPTLLQNHLKATAAPVRGSCCGPSQSAPVSPLPTTLNPDLVPNPQAAPSHHRIASQPVQPFDTIPYEAAAHFEHDLPAGSRNVLVPTGMNSTSFSVPAEMDSPSDEYNRTHSRSAFYGQRLEPGPNPFPQFGPQALQAVYASTFMTRYKSPRELELDRLLAEHRPDVDLSSGLRRIPQPSSSRREREPGIANSDDVNANQFAVSEPSASSLNPSEAAVFGSPSGHRLQSPEAEPGPSESRS